MKHGFSLTVPLAFLLALAACNSPYFLPPKYDVASLNSKVVLWAPGPAELELPSFGTISVPAGADYLMGYDAQVYDFQTNGAYSDGTEAMIRLGAATLRLDYRPTGHVFESDACHIDLARAKAGTQARIAAQNAAVADPAQKRGMGTWILAPHYDAAAHELSYGRLVGTNTKPAVNLFVARLTREGHYFFTWNGSQQDAAVALKSGSPMRQMIDSLKPSDRNLYERHEDGEALADFTVAGFWDTAETAVAYKEVPQDCK